MAALDKLRDKWETITPRERRMVLLLGVSFIVIVVLYVALEISDGLTALEAKNERTRKALRSLDRYRSTARTSAPDDPTKLIGAQAVKLESYIYRAGEKAEVTVPGVNSRSPTTRGRYTAHAASVEIRELTLTQIKDFLEALESESRIVVVSSLQIRRNFRDKEKLDLNLEVVTWSAAPANADGESESGKGGS